MTRRLTLATLGERQSARFALPDGREGFAFRLGGVARAFVNVCAHRLQPVDAGDGALFTADGRIECVAHGAVYDPSTGRCVSGPCPGASLEAIVLEERDGALVALAPDEPPIDEDDYA